MNVAMIKSVAFRGSLLARKYAPEILLGVGIAGGVTSVVLACKATYHVKELNDHTKELFTEIKTAKENNPEYSDEFYQQDMGHAYIETALNYLKLYGPAVGIGVASIACILASHGIMSRRYASLAAAYEVVSEGFKKYRARVAEQLGEEKEKELRLKEETVVETNSEEKTSQEAISTSPYGRWFEAGNVHYQTSALDNEVFLNLNQTYANHLLNSRGHIFLNEVYDMLGLERSPAGAVCGWLKKGKGDKQVVFNMYCPSRKRDDDKGMAQRIWLDFNVEGEIWSMI